MYNLYYNAFTNVDFILFLKKDKKMMFDNKINISNLYKYFNKFESCTKSRGKFSLL